VSRGAGDDILQRWRCALRSGCRFALILITLAVGAFVEAQRGSAAGSVASQEQVFRSGVDTVPIYATVTDRAGALVADLEHSDFEVYDNGRRQKISLFGSGIQAITVAILLDRSPSLFDAASRTQSAVIDFTRRLLPRDRACLGSFSHVVSLHPELTGDADALLRHLGDEAPFPAGTALWDAIEAGRVALANEGGRRVILVITDAADNCSRSDVSAVRTSLERDGVVLYVIGVRGREGLSLQEVSALARRTGGWYFELKPTDDIAATMQRVADELHRQYVLGFSPQTLDDKVHRIEVKVARRGLTVRARRSYIASSHATLR
jgi:Ca-activated chloride channel family protein